MDDLTLLQKYEPVVHYTYGEKFFPCAVDEYVKQCSLWLRDNKGDEHQLAAAGELDVEKLAHYSEVPPRHTLYLQFVDEPLDPISYQQWRNSPARPKFVAPGRLARVGLFSRILDSLFNLSLILRGTVPGGTTAAAQIKYAQMQTADNRDVYYGRVIREGGYIVLHYLFFMAMNDWRSSFYGVNDHEADWEQVFVYLSDEGDAEPIPRWVAYASHDFAGDDLRRRWDDPDLRFFDQTHPLVFAGAGSHASYFEQGEYKMAAEPQALLPLKKTLIFLRKFWVENLGQGSADKVDEEVGALLSVPFIDYARGDGVAIGPGQERHWVPIIMTEEMGWIEQYRGLWGLDTQDPLGGERAPAGPKYNRDGSVRVAWYDPLGWAGLDKVPPPGQTPAKLREQLAALDSERANLQQQIEQQRADLRRLNLEVRALRETEYLGHLHKTRQAELDTRQADLQSLYARYTRLAETQKATRAYLEKIERGDWGDPQAHIKHKHPPEPPIHKMARITELWAAISSGLLLMVFAVLLALAPSQWLVWTVSVGVLFLALEATMRGRIAGFLINITIVLAVLITIILVKDFWWLILLAVVLVAVVAMIAANLRELWESS
ncbi:MAG: hypothetical protein D6768_10320 [Chloroflexi bacterium]|nr:MAG: hypothetical protein D6768_10320 [Chloroflexota bacterium]